MVASTSCPDKTNWFETIRILVWVCLKFPHLFLKEILAPKLDCISSEMATKLSVNKNVYKFFCCFYKYYFHTDVFQLFPIMALKWSETSRDMKSKHCTLWNRLRTSGKQHCEKICYFAKHHFKPWFNFWNTIVRCCLGLRKRNKTFWLGEISSIHQFQDGYHTNEVWMQAFLQIITSVPHDIAKIYLQINLKTMLDCAFWNRVSQEPPLHSLQMHLMCKNLQNEQSDILTPNYTKTNTTLFQTVSWSFNFTYLTFHWRYTQRNWNSQK